MAKMKSTTNTKSNRKRSPETGTASDRLLSLYDQVFAPFPPNIEAHIRALLPPPEPVDETTPLAFLQNFKPEGWNPFAELMWNFVNRGRGESIDPFTQPEVDSGIAYLDEEFRA